MTIEVYVLSWIKKRFTIVVWVLRIDFFLLMLGGGYKPTAI